MKNKLHTILCALIFAPVIVFGQPSFTLVKDINPGSASGDLDDFFEFNGCLYFTATDGIHGTELWKSSGTEATTTLLKDINIAGSSNPHISGIFNGELYFSADDGVHGVELWKTDGTEVGTVLLKDINPTGNGFYQQKFNILNGNIYFVGDDGIHGFELWKSDGTEIGTEMVIEISPSVNSAISGLTLFNNLLFFGADDGVHGFELWKSDGTGAGTSLVKDINPGIGRGFGDDLGPVMMVIGQTLFFIGDDNGNNEEFWKTDGTESGTVMIKDINPSGDGYSSTQNTNVKDLIFEFHGKLIFRGHNQDSGWELWASDGTEAGTVMLNDIYPGTGWSLPVVPLHYIPNDNFPFFYFMAEDPDHGRELWRSDGTPIGTYMIKDLEPGPVGSFVTIPWPPISVSHNNLFYFTHFTTATGRELWRSDGTDAGTFMVKDIWPGPTGITTNGLGPSLSDNDFFTYTSVDDGTHGVGLWRTDGTEAGTQYVADQSMVYQTKTINGAVYASIITPALGAELWISSLAALPISLFDFTGHLAGKDAKLNWKTTGEEQNSSYVLERSFDRINFLPVTTIAARNVPGTNAYYYTDLNVAQAGKTFAYYRIKQIEPNRQPSYSAIVAIRMSGGNYWVKIQPNPVKSQLNIQLNSNKSEHSTLNIISMQGSVLMTKEITIRTGMQSISWDINKLPAGSYLLTIKDNEKVTKEMFIKN